MHRRTVLTFIGCCSPLGIMSPVSAEISNVNDAINRAGAQRMLSQRMSKAYLAVGLEVSGQKAQDVINDSMARFDRQLVELSAFAPRAEIKSTYTELEAVWSKYKALLVGHAPHRDRVATLLDLDDKVLQLAHQGTVQLEQLSGKPSGRLVNLCGRQRMLSQRAAKYFLAQAWKAPVPQANSEMTKAREEFTAALQTLEQAPEATAAIRQELDLARKQWVFFDLAINYQGNLPRAAENVFVSSENVLSVMDRLTGMYSRLTS